MSQESNRRTVTVIVAPINGVESLHFCGAGLQGEDQWYPIRQDLFVTVEVLMVALGAAHNVTSVSKLRECGPSIDYEVTYNLPA
jgi:hypothetical protein